MPIREIGPCIEQMAGHRRSVNEIISDIISAWQAVQSFVRQAMGYIDQTPDKETKVELIKTLQTVTEGKV